ncbi:MAG: hypothetical protein ACLP5H_22570 [Desulfomonilaceae bacterium]
MPRYLLLALFLAACCIVFMAGNLFGGESDTSPQKLKTPQDNLASILKEAANKSSTDTKLSSTKEGSKLKSPRHKTSKKFASHKKTTKKSAYAGKHHRKHQHAYSKSKLHKTHKYRTRTAKKSL